MDYEKEFAGFFNRAGDRAGQIALRYFRGALPVDEKADRSPVTQADRDIEQALRDMVAREFPAHGFVGEEFGATREDAEFVWVVDPIDGTRAFMTGKPLFGSIIGLMHRGKPVMGLVDQPFTRERWLGVAGKIAYHNNAAIRVAPPRDLAAARLYTGSPDMFRGDGFDDWLRLCRAARWPQYGCDCYAYGLMAMGWADLVVEQQLKIYDVAGIVPIITGAGGFAGDWALQDVGFGFDGRFIAASSRELAVEAVAILSLSFAGDSR